MNFKTCILNKISDYQELQKKWSDKSIGFVPTMGALHEGHLELLKKSKSENDITVCSIFVNPTQFNNSEDLAKYPRNLEKDSDLLSGIGVDYLFSPQFEDMYPDKYRYKIEEKEFSKTLCGEHRPGHFDGVLTVVMKLLNIIRPQRAYFGEKDFQQLQLVQDMVRAFFMNVEIIPVPTVRDEKGLALSSRNTRLSPKGIEKAQFFAKTLQTETLPEAIEQKLINENIEVEYVKQITNQGPLKKVAAVWIEGVRLIDNV